MPFIKVIGLRYKLLGTYNILYERRGQKFRLFFSVGGAYVVRTSSFSDELLSN